MVKPPVEASVLSLSLSLLSSEWRSPTPMEYQLKDSAALPTFLRAVLATAAGVRPTQLLGGVVERILWQGTLMFAGLLPPLPAFWSFPHSRERLKVS